MDFPLFHSGQVFYQLVCPLTVVLPQIFFNLTTLFSYPVFFTLFDAPPAVVCGILESISGLEPSLVINEPRYLKLLKSFNQSSKSLINQPLLFKRPIQPLKELFASLAINSHENRNNSVTHVAELK